MRWRFSLLLFVALVLPTAGGAQVRQADQFQILGVLIADNAAARIVMPLGGDGVRLSELGVIDEEKLLEEVRDNGRAIAPGEVVEITAIRFDDDKIEVDLNGGGERGNRFFSLDRIRVGIGGGTAPVTGAEEDAPEGSKIVLRFEDRAPEVLTVEELRTLLSPVLDFNKQNFMDSGIESLPSEFQDAVREGRAVIGMNRSTVTRARGRPNSRSYETSEAGEPEEIWLYERLGFGTDFLTFDEAGILIRIVQQR
jgi:hypothetical protein